MTIATYVPASGCAYTGGPPRRGSEGGDCLEANFLREWRYLDDQNLLLFGRGRSGYHVQMVAPSSRLRVSRTIGVYSLDRWICPNSGDSIIEIGAVVDRRFLISYIKRLTTDELDQIRMQYGIADSSIARGFEEIDIVEVETLEEIRGPELSESDRP